MQAGWSEKNKSDWSQFDLNHNGSIEVYEQRAIIARWNAWCEAIWKKYDVNGDGRLNVNERKKMMDDGENS